MRPPTLLSILSLCSLAAGFSTCGSEPETPPPAASSAPFGEFDAERAWSLLEAQVALGPRPAGSPAALRLREWALSELRQSGLEGALQEFSVRPPASTGLGTVGLANVVATLPAAQPTAPIVVLGAHYDTKRWTARAPRKRASSDILGANDGASGVAVVLELARVLAAAPRRPVEWRFVLFDGEEAFRWDWKDPDNRYGSKHYARELERSGDLGRTRAFVLFDMVGDAQLELARELYSDAELRRVWARAAAAVGKPHAIEPGRGQYIADDHLSFIERGVPSLDVIDFRYPDSSNRYWHSDHDVLEHVSKESLETVGRIAVAALPELERLALEPR